MESDIHDKHGKLCTSSKDINKEFFNFYKDLYRLDTNSSTDALDQFLKNFTLQQITAAQYGNFYTPLTGMC